MALRKRTKPRKRPARTARLRHPWLAPFVAVTATVASLLVGGGLLLLIPDTQQLPELPGQTSFSKMLHGVTTAFDPELGWANVPNQSWPFWGKSSTNDLGTRGQRNFEPATPHILVFGDSVTWGHGVNDESTFPYYMEQGLRNYQVLNAGVSGYGLDQEYLLMKRLLAKTKPKAVVIVIYAPNDRSDSVSSIAYKKSKPVFVREKGRWVLKTDQVNKYSCPNLWSRSWLLNRLTFLQPYRNVFCKPIQTDKGVIDFLLRSMRAAALEHGATPLFVLSGWERDMTKGPSPDLLFFRKVLAEGSYRHLDLTKELATRPDLHSLFLDGGHYSAEGNRIVAERLVRFLAEAGIPGISR